MESHDPLHKEVLHNTEISYKSTNQGFFIAYI